MHCCVSTPNTLQWIKLQQCLPAGRNAYFTWQPFQRDANVFWKFFPPLFTLPVSLSVLFFSGIQTTWSYGWRFSSAPMSNAWMWISKKHRQGNFLQDLFMNAPFDLTFLWVSALCCHLISFNDLRKVYKQTTLLTVITIDNWANSISKTVCLRLLANQMGNISSGMRQAAYNHTLCHLSQYNPK